jgi:hypothetical protein
MPLERSGELAGTLLRPGGTVIAPLREMILDGDGDEPRSGSGPGPEETAPPDSEPRRPSARRTKGTASRVDPDKVAGNAQFDRSEQTQRLDMPTDEHNGAGEPGRGTDPERNEDPVVRSEDDEQA